jgi:hypothetical protein
VERSRLRAPHIDDLIYLENNIKFVDESAVEPQSEKSNSVIRVLYPRKCLNLFATKISFDNIYQFYDCIIAQIRSTQSHLPETTLMWVVLEEPSFAPCEHFDDRDSDICKLHRFLLARHVIVNCGVFVISSQHILQREAIYEKINRQLQLYENGDYVSRDRAMLATRIEIISSESLNHRNGGRHQENGQALSQLCSKYLNTRKYSPMCMPRPAELYPVLVTGLGGAGTHAVANKLTALGMDMPHERLGSDGAVCWFYASNNILIGATYPHHAVLPYSTYLNPRFEYVIHVIRCPLSQISSFTTHLPASYDFVRQHVRKMNQIGANMPRVSVDGDVNPQYGEANSTALVLDSSAGRRDCPRTGQCNLRFAMQSWLLWNTHVSSYADAVFRIEDTTALVQHVCNKLHTQKCREWLQTNHSSQAEVDIELDRGTSVKPTIRGGGGGWIASLFGSQNRDFHSSKYHKLHREYTLDEMNLVDGTLVKQITALAEQFGYQTGSCYSNAHGRQ